MPSFRKISTNLFLKPVPASAVIMDEANERHGEGKEGMEQADEVKLDVAEHKTSAALDVESPMVDQRQLVSKGSSLFAARPTSPAIMSSAAMRSSTESSSELDCVNITSSAALDVESPMCRSGVKGRILKGSAMIASDATESPSELDCVNINSRYIHKVHPGLRSHGEIAKHYEPILVSIGPYHHGKEALQDMENKKIHYTQVLLKIVKKESIDVYMKALKNRRELEQALHCYVDTFTTYSFPGCVVLDGLFMIELFRRREKPNANDKKDMFFTMEWMKPLLQRDLLLFENQIPLFVLRQLFELTKEINPKGDFVELALGFFDINGKRISHKEIEIECLDNIPHLLGLVYEALSVRKGRVTERAETDQQNKCKEFVRKSIQALVPETCKLSNEGKNLWESIRSAAALEEVGVTFVPAGDDVATIYDIKFNGGTLRIPRLVIDDNTESLFRNLVAYEQYSNKCCLHSVTNYVQVMDYLINTPKDVELLRHCGIIENMLGDDVKVSTMFNQICSGVLFHKDKFDYAGMFDEVNKFCKRRRNVWMKKLKNEYFGSPWTLISFMAAVMLLLLTVAQTVFAVISYYKQ